MTRFEEGTQNLNIWHNLQGAAAEYRDATIDWLGSAEFAIQACSILASFLLALIATAIIRKSFAGVFEHPTAPLLSFKLKLYNKQDYLRPLLNILFLGLAIELTDTLLESNLLLHFGQSIAVSILLYTMVKRSISNTILRRLVLWVTIPFAILVFMNWLDTLTGWLASLSVDIGSLEVSALDIVRVAIFGSVLFWLGKVSNNAGKRMIRNQADLDIGTREVIAKLFEVGLFVLIFILLLQIMGINITTLAVFGGALAVGIGFGLQSIASNFISGIIILLDRSLTVGDHIQMEDGQSGIITQLNMRSTTLETYDGKDIMVPNEKFITSTFVNWTHKNIKQRYDINLQVAYGTDLHKLFPLLREVCIAHPKVLSGPNYPYEEQPDAEISSFGDSGINILIEFWMEGIDDGANRVGGDLLLMIWDVLNENGVEIPFPQRVVRMVKDPDDSAG
ncbi:mechanosensitive ion channel family protein [Allohahella sp. A8]|uniref:mechanosensitive ion channel family protein n=1 Tax=Allohahella sp. A8 TaxID=3141461 RepID=UPI000C0B8953|nr:mechanosensitive ion channel protein [Hahellaceae bacterium]